MSGVVLLLVLLLASDCCSKLLIEKSTARDDSIEWREDGVTSLDDVDDDDAAQISSVSAFLLTAESCKLSTLKLPSRRSSSDCVSMIANITNYLSSKLFVSYHLQDILTTLLSQLLQPIKDSSSRCRRCRCCELFQEHRLTLSPHLAGCWLKYFYTAASGNLSAGVRFGRMEEGGVGGRVGPGGRPGIELVSNGGRL